MKRRKGIACYREDKFIYFDYKYQLGITTDILERDLLFFSVLKKEDFIEKIADTKKQPCCPKCKDYDIRKRKTKLPVYRCQDCKFEFDEPLIEERLKYPNCGLNDDLEFNYNHNHNFMTKLALQKKDEITYMQEMNINNYFIQAFLVGLKLQRYIEYYDRNDKDKIKVLELKFKDLWNDCLNNLFDNFENAEQVLYRLDEVQLKKILKLLKD